MPEYTFKCPKCGKEQTVTRAMDAYDKPLKCFEDGVKMGRVLFAGKQKRCDTYPMASYAVGIDSSEVPEMMEFDKKNGVPTEYTRGPDGGDPILTSREHRRKYLKLHGFHDRNSYTGY